MNKRKLGVSLAYNNGRISREVIKSYAKAGIDCVEFAFSYNYVMNKLDFPNHSVKIANMVRAEGMEPWSLHLPFSGRLDISNPCKELKNITLYTDRVLIRAAAKAGLKVVVLHPSSEPIEDDQRDARIEISRESIALLSEESKKYGIKLALENLPRSCLGHTSKEYIKLVEGLDIGAIFDTNHSGMEDDVHFVNALTKAKIPIYSVHISDYYRDENGVLDERHVLPGEGIIDWKKLLAALSKNGYDGPLMYEIRRIPANRTEPVPLEELVDNMNKLRDGKI